MKAFQGRISRSVVLKNRTTVSSIYFIYMYRILFMSNTHTSLARTKPPVEYRNYPHKKKKNKQIGAHR